MKTRILSLMLAVVLLLGLLAMPASAATAKDVYNYLKEVALSSGSYDDVEDCYYSGFQFMSDDRGKYYFFISYMNQTKYVHNAIAYYPNDSAYMGFEVTWKISSNPSPSYNAYMEVYDKGSSANDTTGIVVLPASYNGSAYSSFKSFKGNTQLKAPMLEILNNLLPAAVEFTRAVINDEDYSLKDLGMTGYKKCDWVHAEDKGKLTKAPTCVAEGVTTYTCRVCGNKRTEAVPATGEHKWDQGVVITQPGCTTTGVRRYTCTVCKSATRDETIPSLGGHSWTYTETLTPTEGDEHGTALFTCSRCNETKEDIRCASVVFSDMPAAGNWAHAPIDWAYFGGLTAGKGDGRFAPNDTITRAEVMTFLWITMQRPEPAQTENPFTDVTESKYFYKPVMWAVANGVTSGVDVDRFGPGEKCTRGQIMTFLWNAAGRPEPKTDVNPFTDVNEKNYYYKPVLWAVENNVTGGTSATTFSPNDTCSRAQVMAFLFKTEALLNAPRSQVLELGWYEGEDAPLNTELDTTLRLGDEAEGRVLLMTVKGEGVPELLTDREDLVRVIYDGLVETTEDGACRYGWRLEPIGEPGEAKMRLLLDRRPVGSFTVTVEQAAPQDPAPQDPVEP